MNCKFCSSNIPDDGVFCPNCGQQVDGKNICAKCGKIFDGTFCPTCGTKATAKKQSKTLFERFLGVEKIISPTIFLALLFGLFICSLFVGITLTFGDGSTTRLTTFYFFGDIYSYLSASGSPYAPSIIFAILCTIAMATNIIISFLSLITGAIKYGKSLSRGENFSLANNVALSITTFFVATAIASGLNYTLSNVSVSNLSYGTIIGIALSAMAIVSVTVLRQITLGKKVLDYFNLCKLIMLTICFALTVGLISSASLNFATIVSSTTETKIGIFNFSEMVSSIVRLMTATGVSTSHVTAYLILSVLLQGGLLVIGAFIVRAIILGYCGKDSNIKPILILSIVAFLVTILYAVFGILCLQATSELITLSGGLIDETLPKTWFILSIIVGVLQCAASTFYYILMKKQS